MNNYTDINTAQLAEILRHKNVLILDVRKNKEFKSGHLKNAQNYDLQSLESKISQLNSYKNNEIIVYCSDGVKSANAASILCANGFTKVYNLAEGISAYKGNLVKK